ncbi:MAG: HEAT repeat domain-containing protein [Planctomycetes bacterium]|nr:HEAT repeat domain-containing protein [Planctomycetota bacterium]
MAEKSSVVTLLELLGDQDERLRRAAITALGLIRSEVSARGLRSHGGKPGLGPVEARRVEEALGRLEGREPARLK